MGSYGGLSLVVIPLLLLAFTAVFYQAIAFDAQDNYLDDAEYTNSSSIYGGMVENETETSLEMEGYEMTVGIDAVDGVFVVLIASIAIAVVSGIRVLGSGLSDFTVRLITFVGIFYCFWLFFSLFAIEAFSLFPFGFGWMIYVVMTLVYSAGVVQLS